MFKLGERSSRRLEGVDPRIYKIVELALTITLIDFGIAKHGGLRQQELQNQLYRNKKSQCDGYIQVSSHQLGKAFDIYAYIDGKASWNKSDLTHIATAILCAASLLGFPLVWGGHWKNFKDLGHFEFED